MKLNKSNIFNCLAASAVVLFSACSNEESFNVPSNDPEVFGDGSKVVTFVINNESGVSASRADNPYPADSHISDGSLVDVLVFAVYEKGTDDNYVLAPQFKKEGNVVGDFGSGNGQNALSVSKTAWPVTIKFAFDPSKTYKIAFWAQNSSCTAFTTTDLTNVKVNYTGALNNDEFRDAFCAVSEEITGEAANREVILHRPFAQINVGTSGADYNNILNGKYVVPNKAIKYSQITIKNENGINDQINVLTDVISASNDAPKSVTFAWNKIPAFVHFTDFPENLLGKEVTNGDDDDNVTIGRNDNEEFLVVNLNGGDTFEDYLTSYPTISREGENVTYLTETFKYLSMCYVLVDASKVESPANKYDVYSGATLDELSVTFAQLEGGNDYTGVPAFSEYMNIKQVPVHRNWRTNILAGLHDPTDPDDPDDPNDPEDPDDPTSVLKTTKVCVNLCPIFFNENNGLYGQGENGSTSWIEAGTDFSQDGDSLHGQHGDHTGSDASTTPGEPEAED